MGLKIFIENLEIHSPNDIFNVDETVSILQVLAK